MLYTNLFNEVSYMFNNATTWTKQGDIGEAYAIFKYTQLGYTVSRTLFDSAPYDLLIDDGVSILKVQVRTTAYKTPEGVYQATLRVSGGNSTSTNVKKRIDGEYDLLFVLADNSECWSIPANILPRSSVNLGTKYNDYRLLS